MVIRGSVLGLLVLVLMGCQDSIPILEPPVEEADRVAFYNALDSEIQSWERLDAEGRHQEAMMQGRRVGWIAIQNRPYLVEALLDTNDSHKAVAAAAAGFTDDEAFNPQLRQCQTTGDPRVVANALTSLGLLRYHYLDPRMVAFLLGCDQADVRAAAAFYLGRSMSEAADEEVLGPLVRATTDPDVLVRHNAVSALGEIRDPAAIRPLADRLSNDPDPRVRIAAARSLGKIGGDGSTGALLSSLEGQGDVETKRETYAALESSSGLGFGRDERAWWSWWQARLSGRPNDWNQPPPPSSGQWPPSRREGFQPGIRPSDPNEGARATPEPWRPPVRDPAPERPIDATPPPERPLPQPPEPARPPEPAPSPERPPQPAWRADVRTSLSVLEFGTPSDKARAEADLVALGPAALPGIFDRLGSSEEGLSVRLLAIIGRIGDRSAVPELKRVFERPDLLVRLSALESIGALGGTAELAFYESALQDRWAKVRRKAARLVLDARSTKGIPVFLDSLEDPDPLVRGHAIQVLREATGQDFAFDPAAGEPARRQAVQQWREWWSANEATFTLR